MGSGSVGRSLVVQHAVLACVALAFGAYAYSCVTGLEASVPALPANGTAALAVAAERAGFNIAVGALVATMGVALVSYFVSRVAVLEPLRALADAAAQSADGAAADIPGTTRADAFGTIARSIEALRAARAVGKDDAADQAKDEAWQDRNRELTERVNRFTVELGATVRRLGSMTKRLGDATGQMAVAAKQANEGSDHATVASSNAAGDVSSVATASEQLLHSIEEISRQVVQATSVVHSAVERAVDTNAGMGRLSTAAQKVGDVISLISRIAAQTNLLALNATIEAARAGEAGRGFAVVAQEVKTLATQTAKATQDITGQIAEMQEATDLSVEAIGKIQTKIAEVQHISTIIASAVHEQGAATQEIARNVRSAAAGTATMSSQIENVVRSIADTSANASSITLLAHDFDEIATSLTDMVTAFGQTLRAA